MTDNFLYPDNTLYSNCCREKDRLMYGADVSYSELSICPKCKDWCEFVTEGELENEK